MALLSGRTTGHGRATVLSWDDDEGWGVLDVAGLDEPCWCHFSAIQGPGFRTLTVGDVVELEWERAEQDGYHDRATSVVG